MEKTKKAITLYDAGGLIILVLFFGIPAGAIFDYLWNLIVFSLALLFLRKYHSSESVSIRIGWRRKLAYCFFITLLGIVIDWAYFELTWDTFFGNSAVWAPVMAQPFQLVWLLLPMLMIWLVNATLSYSFLKLERRQTIILGAIMAFFTAPWLLPTAPYILGWVM